MEEIITSVYETLGGGYSECVYQSALEVELRLRNIPYNRATIHVQYKGYSVGELYTDIVVDNKCILELKAVKRLTDDHMNQLKMYMKHLEITEGYLVNFGDTLTIQHITPHAL